MNEEDLRRQVMREMKGDLNKKMDRMIENLKIYRREFGGNRVPTFLMSKQQLAKHRQQNRE